MLRRALLVWGWGHIALGDRRGWLLAALHALAVVGLLLIAWELIDGTLWLLLFVPLLALLVVWVGQAVHAHRRALALGGASGGELQLALFLPFALAVMTGFWLVGGRHGSAAATVEAYMEAWQSNSAQAALGLFMNPGLDTAELQDFWSDELAALSTSLAEGRSTYGRESGLDPARPFNSMRVSELTGTAPGEAEYTVEIVRSERYQTTLLGLVPTAGQRTIVLRSVARITLREEPSRANWLPTSTWRVVSVSTPGGRRAY